MKRSTPARIVVALALFALSAWPARAEEPAYPEPTGFVVDAAGLLREDTRTRIESICQELSDKTGVQLAVALVPSIAPLEIEDYAVRLFKKWGVGRKKEDDGVLFVLAKKERRVRIEVGYGMEPLLPDGRVGGILRSVVVPRLRQDEWDGGVLAGVEALAVIIAKDRGVELASLAGVSAPEESHDDTRATPLPVLLLVIGFFVILIIISAAARSQGYSGRRRGGWGGAGFGGFGGGSSGGGFGGVGGGSSGGGFGGFGGGSSGGGGASSGF